jgi:hypothetical protein
VKKLYKVQVTISVPVVVLAEDAHEAEGLALGNWMSEAENEESIDSAADVSRILSAADVPDGWLTGYPYGQNKTEKTTAAFLAINKDDM